MRKILTFLFPFLLSIIFGQAYSIESIVEDMVAQRDSSRLLFITHPGDSSQINIHKSRFGAWVRDTSAKVTVQGRAVKVWPSGAVADMITLEPGWNSVPFFVESKWGIEETIIHVFRDQELEATPERPTVILDTLMSPSTNRAYYGANEINVSFHGSPGGKATFYIKGLTSEPFPMKETSSGIYSGLYRIKDTDNVNSKKVVFKLKGKRGWVKKRSSAGRISVIPNYQPRVAKTAIDHTLVHYGINGEIFMDLPIGVELELKADYGYWCKVEAAEGHSGFVRKSSLEFPVSGEILDRAYVNGISADEDTNWVYLTFNTSEKVPFDITHHLEPNRISVTLFRTYFQNEWTNYPENKDVLNYLDWVQVDDSAIRFDFILSNEQSWGFYGKYNGNRFVLALRKPPVFVDNSPFQGLSIAIDAGHGGDHKGALGATGLMEKDVNLVYSYYLKDILEKEGAKVIMTRSDDTTMGLSERMDIAFEENTQLFLWMHNNSTGLLRHPEEIKGASTYYTPLQGLEFARSIYPHLTNLGLEPEGFVHRSYYMTRQTYMPVILVEGAFLSNPEDEMFLMSDENLRNLAQAVADGLRERLGEIGNQK